MRKHSRCVIGICGNDMWYPELHKKYSNVDGGTMIHKLPKDGAVRVVWINAILKYKTVIQESLNTVVTVSLLDLHVTASQCLIKSIQVQQGSPRVFPVQVQYAIKSIQIQ